VKTEISLYPDNWFKHSSDFDGSQQRCWKGTARNCFRYQQFYGSAISVIWWHLWWWSVQFLFTWLLCCFGVAYNTELYHNSKFYLLMFTFSKKLICSVNVLCSYVYCYLDSYWLQSWTDSSVGHDSK